MATTVTKTQKQHIQSVLSGLSKAEILTTIEERHQFVLNWNWDESLTPLEWIINQTDTDKGTAVLIYWLCSPGYIHQYKHKKDVPKDLENIYALVRKIEKNIAIDYYSSEKIAFDPTNDNGSDYTLEYKGLTLAFPIPEALFNATKGLAVERITL